MHGTPDDGHVDLALDPAARWSVLAALERVVASHVGGVDELRVVPSDDDTLAALGDVAAIDLEVPSDPVELVGRVEAILRRGIVHTGHPGYLGLFNPAASVMGIVGDALAATFNPQLAVVSHAPAAAAIEAACTDLLVRRTGLPDGSVGQFTSGGSEANLLGILVALHRAFPGVAADGLHTLDRQPTVYVSDEAHHSILKLAQAIGLGRSAVRTIAVDDHGRMDGERLADAIRQDRAAVATRAPFLVVATAGTTGGGAIDPLADIASLAGDEGLHVHVDAAWAGALVLSDRHRQLLAGIERADSVTIDAHKWLSAPMGAGVFLTPHTDALRHAFAVDTGYMPSAETTDPYLTGLQWSRRFTGLKVFLTLAAAGRRGLAAEIDRMVELGGGLRSGLVADGWRLRNRTQLPIVCVDDPAVPADTQGDHLRAVVDAVTATGSAWLSLVDLDGRPAIRACITSYRTDPATLDAVRHRLRTIRDRRRSSSPPTA
jgi:aromatic-L-amino-acid/L-tryptophan decarboxylase